MTDKEIIEYIDEQDKKSRREIDGYSQSSILTATIHKIKLELEKREWSKWQLVKFKIMQERKQGI